MKIIRRTPRKSDSDTMAEIFKGEKLTTEAIAVLDERALEMCYDTGMKAIECLAANGDGIRRQCTTLLGWLIAALASLTGVLVYNFSKQIEFNLITIMSAYGIFAITAIAIYLTITTQRGISTLGPGDHPSLPIRQEVRDCFDEGFEPEAKYKFILGWYLNTIELQYKDHTTINHKLFNAYRKTLLFVLIAAIVGFILFFVLLFIFRNN